MGLPTLCVLSVSLLNFLWCILLHTGCQYTYKEKIFVILKLIPIFLTIEFFFRAEWGRTGVKFLQPPNHSTRRRVIYKHWWTEACKSKGGMFWTFLFCFNHKSGVKCVLCIARFHRVHRLVLVFAVWRCSYIYFQVQHLSLKI